MKGDEGEEGERREEEEEEVQEEKRELREEISDGRSKSKFIFFAASIEQLAMNSQSVKEIEVIEEEEGEE